MNGFKVIMLAARLETAIGRKLASKDSERGSLASLLHWATELRWHWRMILAGKLMREND